MSEESSFTIMSQMYKVFTKDKCIFLLEDEKGLVLDEYTLLVRYVSKKQLSDEIEQFEMNNTADCLYILHKNADELWTDFKSLFQIIEAAGGLVKNSGNRILFIFRNGKWDLPKGKIEIGEEVREAAIREVKEECGIQKKLIITRELPSTYHIYTLNEERILKKTAWFEMLHKSNEKLKPQTEENITDVKWLDANEIKEALKNTYPSIRAVIAGA